MRYAKLIQPWRALALAISVMMLPGCERGDEPAPVPASKTRVISLAPALTQIIVDLGAADLLVAVAENDYAAPEGLPTVGPYPQFSAEAIIAADPAIVLLLHGDGTPLEYLRDLAEQQGFLLMTYPYPGNIEDVVALIWSSDDVNANRKLNQALSVSTILSRVNEGLNLRNDRFLKKLASLSDIVDEDRRRRPRVLLVIESNPVQVVGEQEVLDNTMSMFLRARNAADSFRGGAPTLDKEMLGKTNADVILMLMPNAPPLKSINKDPRLAPFRDLDIPAVKNNRITLINDPLVLLPSTSLVRIGVAMSKAIHPDLADRFDDLLSDEDKYDDPGITDNTADDVTTKSD